MLQTVLKRIETASEERLGRLFDWLKIESISTDSAYHEACVSAAAWAHDQLTEIGFKTKTIETTGKPIVVAEWLGKPGARTVLFYGHYDVQPVDPLDLWDHPPFDPIVKDGEIKGRGTSDDKGQVMTFVEACRAWMAEDGSLPINVKIMLEGEEESGSPSLPAFFDDHGESIKADLALVCDTGMWDADTPSITTRLRGMLLVELFLEASDRDLHSGMYGGAAINPIRVLTRIISDLHDDEGRITLDGFYDAVEDPNTQTLQQWENLASQAPNFLKEVGLEVPAGETNHSWLEQVWSRPTCDVNGIVGGYIGEGSKTIVPAKASAKVSFRLVPGQDPDLIFDAFKAHVEARLPKDVKATYAGRGGDGAVVVDDDLPGLSEAQSALSEAFPNPAVLAGCGGSIPIVKSFKDKLRMETLLIGFGLDDDRIHSPNEKYDLSSFDRGTLAWARILHALA